MPRLFYGYVILGLCFLNMIFVRGVAGSFSVFYVALLEEFHWSHGVGASIVSINSLVYALASPLVGWAFDRLGPRLLMPLGGVLIGCGLLTSGLSQSLWQLYLFYGFLVAMGQGALGFVSHTALISRWFVRRRGTAIGLSSMGQGCGMLLIVPLAQLLISLTGWRSAFMLLGALVLCVLTPANALLQRGSPGDVGQLPDGEIASGPDEVDPHHRRRTGGRSQWTPKSALRSFPFWSITAGHLALGTGLFIIYTHLVAYLVYEGFDRLFAAFALGLTGFIRIGGTSLWGFVSDRLGSDKAYGISTVITLTGILCLGLVGSDSPPWLVYASIILYGIGHSAGNPIYGVVIADIFGGSHVGTIFGLLEIGFGFGMALGAWLGGAIFDLTGSYRWAFAVGLAAFTISFLAVQASVRWQRRQEAWGH